MCPFCWPHDAAHIDFDAKKFVCSHCGTEAGFDVFAELLRDAMNDRLERAEADKALLFRVEG